VRKDTGFYEVSFKEKRLNPKDNSNFLNGLRNYIVVL